MRTLKLSLSLLVLLAFACAGHAKDETPSAAAKTAKAGSGTVKAKKAKVLPRAVVVYYLHPTWRCARCMAFEAYAEEALKTGFPKELESGKVVWRSLNTEEAANEHFISDYKLVTKSLIVSDVRKGKEKSWKNLDQIWNLVGNKEAYIKYVQDSVREVLKSK